MSVQVVADASQKFTCPGLTAVPPAFTCAVSVTALPAATEVTELPPEVMPMVVLVAVFDCAAASSAHVQINADRTKHVAAARVLRDRL
jgi:hypothetical protein